MASATPGQLNSLARPRTPLAPRDIGRAVAFGPAAGGVRRVLLACCADPLARTARESTVAGSAELLVFSADVGDDQQLRDAVTAAQTRLPIRILIRKKVAIGVGRSTVTTTTPAALTVQNSGQKSAA